MKRLRPTDGTPVHLRAARFHASMCASGPPLMLSLGAQISTCHNTLRATARAHEDAKDAAVHADAEATKAEYKLQDTIRDLDAAMASADRSDPSLSVQSAVFPNGYGEIIEPEGEDQLTALGPLYVKLAPYKNHPTIAPVLARLDADATALKNALDAALAADKAVDLAFAEELQARKAIREQLESAHGQLRSFYKARPALAERYFLNEGTSRRAKKEPEGGGNDQGTP